MKNNFDTPILLIFFNRPSYFKEVLKQVSLVKPTTLFLSQDGPRNSNDLGNINKCREFIDQIDWDCKIYKNYNDSNKGCGEHVPNSISWAFSYTDRLIILEDDCVPSKSFFYFCDTLLKKFNNDERIFLITGMNHLDYYLENDNDYFFSNIGSIAGIATWKRVWEKVDFDLNIINDYENKKALFRNIEVNSKKLFNSNILITVKNLRKKIEKGEKLSSWSSIFGFYTQVLNSQFLIVPTKNLVRNIGISGVHTPSEIKLISKSIRKIYKLNLYELDFPLKEPEFVMRDTIYENKVLKLMKPNLIIKNLRKLESLVYRIIFSIIDRKNYFKKNY
ncbi:MAG: hypothetical protein QME48_06185 [bacterium]|uniref:Hemolysin hemolytic protein n=2 Tax=Bacteria candidate phyla TaxID=1783234 RepID=A0A117M740_UNCT6|nr:MAG: Hemolysin hemolytic protein [candidate division TA06 bacterium 32_111]KUK88002.1 MAG: Hemolysin hemolytic protein [candidate division TA06 bacterium 34_109]MDI6700806.1 hypothetical protein [bacterium]HAF06930.1 hypothetical protein [candidate division WOR-3 bacterium]HCP16844.1 hypothetical protein [candidate division WOR-3 bacterium]